MKVTDGADKLGEDSLDDIWAEDVAMRAGYVKQITTGTVCQNYEGLSVTVIEGLEVDE
jgi:hypothetical protein